MASLSETWRSSKISASRWIARQLLVASQHIRPFRARGGYSRLAGRTDRFAKSEIELNDDRNFVSFLEGFDFDGCIRGRDVLDFGSGYGGRTVWMARLARSVHGIEIRPSCVETSQAFAAARGAQNVSFSVGSETSIDFPDASFDVVVTFDVLEHVRHPDLILAELFRVLRPGGTAVVIFTPYYGMFAHHLNYVSLWPGLHWLFSPEDLIHAVHETFATHPELRAAAGNVDLTPGLSYNGKRKTLPTLNGLTKSEFEALVPTVGFESQFIRSTPLLKKHKLAGSIGVHVNRVLTLAPRGDEIFSHNLVAVLRRPT